jgi:hypothetical protein
MTAARPLALTDRVELVPTATRRLGHDLYLSVRGAAGTVERLAGHGPELWRLLGDGSTLAEAASALSDRTGAPVERVEPRVLDFAEGLVAVGMARVVEA